MATNYTSLDMTKLEMAVQGALKYALIPISAFSKGVSSEGMAKDDVVKAIVGTDPTAQTKTVGTALTANGTLTGVSITLDTVKSAKFDLIEGNVPSSRLQSYAEGLFAGSVYSIVKALFDSALGLVTATNFATKVTCSEADFGQLKLAELMKAAEDKKLGRNRSLILNAGYASQLVGSSSLGLILATMGDQALKTAKLPPLLGMNSYMYSGLPTNSENLGGMVIDPSAIGVVMAPMGDLLSSGQGDVLENGLVSEPESGVTVNMRMTGDGDGGKLSGHITLMYGVAKIQDALVRVVTA
jgi:hypothetical protein